MRSNHIFRYPYLFVLFVLLFSVYNSSAKAADGYYYQLKIYHLKTQAQEDRIDHYLQNAYLPALHRLGIKNVGVFKPVEADTSGKRVYVLIPFKTWEQIKKTDQQLGADQQYLTDGADYIDAAHNEAPYTRMETILLSAFPKMLSPDVPQLTANKIDRVYELRSYESATEKYNVNKVKMFNDGNEVALFKRLGFNAVFYAEVLAGSHMPNLMYMTTFNNKADRDKHWDAFSNDPEWKVLVAKKEFQNNVSKADILFLHPTAYSDF
ncbi:NIPSNAP family protein [Mucilaginibacter sp.]|uniref:NIPSNAP family protein n=1 Tax=Mucilaginibacter sp. TaxID=1882438 RepID=UPI0026295F5E|nr:NIPSNAP family protein [Mucilaginibacter sp.]MDB4918221.1 family containing protein [Mucilaginibacter sp.]